MEFRVFALFKIINNNKTLKKKGNEMNEKKK